MQSENGSGNLFERAVSQLKKVPGAFFDRSRCWRRAAASRSTGTDGGAGRRAVRRHRHINTIEDLYRRQPTRATVSAFTHTTIVSRIYSRKAVDDEVAAARTFHRRIATIDPSRLSAPNQLDRQQLLHEIDSRLLTLEVVKPGPRIPI